MRGTTRAIRSGSRQIEAAGVEPLLGDPDRIATIAPAFEHVSVACVLLGSAIGSAEGAARAPRHAARDAADADARHDGPGDRLREAGRRTARCTSADRRRRARLGSVRALVTTRLRCRIADRRYVGLLLTQRGPCGLDRPALNVSARRARSHDGGRIAGPPRSGPRHATARRRDLGPSRLPSSGSIRSNRSARIRAVAPQIRLSPTRYVSVRIGSPRRTSRRRA